MQQRKNIRLQGYDYSRAGLYFLTIAVQNRLHLFGQIHHGGMMLNDAGRMIEKWYREIENKYPDKRCHEMVVMPNHFHCIIENLEMQMDANVSSTDAHVRPMDAHVRPMDAHVRPMDAHVRLMDAHARPMDAHVRPMDAHVGAPLRGRSGTDGCPEIESRPETTEKYGIHNQKYGATIGDVMDWFKTMTTNEYIRGVKNMGWERYDGKLWQRNYYDRIIRNWEEDLRIATYIVENPQKWKDDKFNQRQLPAT
ncbi:MAG: hypothetical protein BGN96_05650 [Bacteroidales bacterium 45-6]|nr:MAG: hypothetical protein BGN96_05650 [Bacteroidales bacterium 45-6]